MFKGPESDKRAGRNSGVYQTKPLFNGQQPVVHPVKAPGVVLGLFLKLGKPKLDVSNIVFHPVSGSPDVA
jgi:hypothetical protein